MVQIKCLTNGLYSLKNSHIPLGMVFNLPPFSAEFHLNSTFLTWGLPLTKERICLSYFKLNQKTLRMIKYEPVSGQMKKQAENNFPSFISDYLSFEIAYTCIYFEIAYTLRCGQQEGKECTDEKNRLRPYGLPLKRGSTWWWDYKKGQKEPK